MTKEVAAGDPILQSVGNPLYRYEDLLMRRRIAALSEQPRTVQRYTKKIAAFRYAFGLPQLNDEPDYSPQYDMDKRDDEGTSEPLTMQASEDSMYDRAWMAAQTMHGLARVTDAFKGNVRRNKLSTGIVEYQFASAGKKPVTLRVIENSWCTSAFVENRRLPLFDANENASGDERGIPVAIAAEDWGGTLPIKDAQSYMVSWAKLMRIIGGAVK